MLARSVCRLLRKNTAAACSARPEAMFATRGACAELVDRGVPVVWSKAATHEGAPLSAAECDEYSRNGFVIMRSVLSADTVAALHDALQCLSKHPPQDDAATVFEPDTDDTVVRSVFAPHVLLPDSAATAVATRSVAVDAARQLLADDVYIHQCRINFQPAFVGTGFNWHSDFETWHAEDGMPLPRALSAVVPTVPFCAQNGAVMFMPGSHNTFARCPGAHGADNWRTSLRLQQQYGVPTKHHLAQLADDHGIVHAEANPGDIVLFDCNLMHGSHTNITPWARTSLFVVFNAWSNQLRAPFAKRQDGTVAPRPEHLAHRQHVWKL